jgi:uncharacterized membrane-anchored protein YhcB (DUF1043 family)
MDLLLSSPAFWIAVGVALAVGFGIGRATGANAQKLRDLEATLDAEQQAHLKTRGESEGYRTQVSTHFAETSERLHDLTLQYRSVYEHLAKGASELCPESMTQLEGGLGLDALPEEAEEPQAKEPQAHEPQP